MPLTINDYKLSLDVLLNFSVHWSRSFTFFLGLLNFFFWSWSSVCLLAHLGFSFEAGKILRLFHRFSHCSGSYTFSLAYLGFPLNIFHLFRWHFLIFYLNLPNSPGFSIVLVISVYRPLSCCFFFEAGKILRLSHCSGSSTLLLAYLDFSFEAAKFLRFSHRFDNWSGSSTFWVTFLNFSFEAGKFLRFIHRFSHCSRSSISVFSLKVANSLDLLTISTHYSGSSTLLLAYCFLLWSWQNPLTFSPLWFGWHFLNLLLKLANSFDVPTCLCIQIDRSVHCRQLHFFLWSKQFPPTYYINHCTGSYTLLLHIGFPLKLSKSSDFSNVLVTIVDLPLSLWHFLIFSLKLAKILCFFRWSGSWLN